jgi:hypothetical protein
MASSDATANSGVPMKMMRSPMFDVKLKREVREINRDRRKKEITQLMKKGFQHPPVAD